MGFKRECNFEDDIELLNLKYQMNGAGLGEYFTNELGANEMMQNGINNQIKQEKNQWFDWFFSCKEIVNKS